MNSSGTKRELRILGEISLGRDPGFLYVVASSKKLLNGRHYVQKPWIAVATALLNELSDLLPFRHFCGMYI